MKAESSPLNIKLEHLVSSLSGSITVGLVVEEEGETAAGSRSPETMETGPNQLHVMNALNSESVVLLSR